MQLGGLRPGRNWRRLVLFAGLANSVPLLVAVAALAIGQPGTGTPAHAGHAGVSHGFLCRLKGHQ